MMTKLQHLLLKLGEECCEVAKEASKCSQFGMNESAAAHEADNKARLHAELNDVFGIITMLNVDHDFGFDFDAEAGTEKIKKVILYRQYSIDLGLVEGEKSDDADARMDCPALEARCAYFTYQCDRNGELAITFCNHPDNPKEDEGNAIREYCPRMKAP